MTPELINRLAREAGLGVAAEVPHNAQMLQAFAAKVAAHEREECARLCEMLPVGYRDCIDTIADIACADAIRARK